VREMLFDLIDGGCLGETIFALVMEKTNYESKNLLAQSNKKIREKIFTESNNNMLLETMIYNCNPFHNRWRPIEDILKKSYYQDIMSIIQMYHDEIFISSLRGPDALYHYNINYFIRKMLKTMFEQDLIYILGNLYDISWNDIMRNSMVAFDGGSDEYDIDAVWF
jgi:hypothetical protein